MMNEAQDDDSTVSLSGPASAAGGSADAAPRQGGPDEQSGNALPVGTRLAEFEIRGVIGEGGFSIVYLAWDHSLHRSVALKEYIPAELAVRDGSMRVTARSQRHRETFDVGLKSFVNEARLLASFDHHSLVKVHRFWEDRGTAFMVMPWYQGQTLKQTLASSGRAPDEAWLLRMLGSLTEALLVLHEQQCYHRDIAPDNIILLGATQTPLLLDFGAARRVIGNLTQDLTAILKKGYAPLEQYGEIPGMRQGPWTDVYALAAVVHYAIRGSTPPAAVGRLVNDTYEPLLGSGERRYSAGLLAAIDKALAVRPEDRTPSIGAFRQQLGLDHPLGVTPTTVPVPAPPSLEPDAGHAAIPRTDRPLPVPPRDAPGRSGAAMWVAVALAAVVVLGGAAYAWRASHADKAPASAEPVAHVESAASVAVAQALALAVQPPPAAVKPVPTEADLQAARDAEAELARSKGQELEARRKTVAVLADFQQLAQSEKRDVGPLVQQVRHKQERAQAAALAGRFDEATALDDDGTAVATQALNGLVSELVSSYGRIAEQATAANQLDIAQQALSRAKKVDALRR